MEERGSAGRDRDEGPSADEYLRRQAPIDRGVLIPVVGLVALVVGTWIAFSLQGPPVVESDPPPPAAPPAGSMPVSGSFDEAVGSLEARLAEAPGDTLALAALAELMLSAHQPERALELVDRWLVESPDSPRALLQRVMSLAALERWEEALDVNRGLLEQEPTWLLAQLNMGALYGNLGDFEEARKWWNGIVEAAPDSPEAGAARRALEQAAEREQPGL